MTQKTILSSIFVASLMAAFGPSVSRADTSAIEANKVVDDLRGFGGDDSSNPVLASIPGAQITVLSDGGTRDVVGISGNGQ
jgi:hypothetical protein